MMWKKPWNYKEGLFIGLGLLIAGEALQFSIGSIRWSLLAAPVNLIAGAVYLIALLGMFFTRKRVYLFRWLSTPVSAAASLLWTAAITVVMGFIRQQPAGAEAHHTLFGFTQMTGNWAFVLLYFWMMTSLGLTILRTAVPFRRREVPFLLCHIGLFIALGTATLGSADMRRLRMTVPVGKTEWRASNEENKQEELPIAIELKQFSMDEYPPKLMMIDNATGEVLPKGSPYSLLLEDSLTEGMVGDWHIQIEEHIPLAAAVMGKDTVRFVPFPSEGGTYAVRLQAVNRQGVTRSGWVSCGSFTFPYKTLKLDSLTSLVMPDREPKRFASDVKVYTKAGDMKEGTIEVNHPMRIGGWDIYQLSYDAEKGRWSEISVFELVRDPSLPIVYIGIALLALGAIGMFLGTGKRKEEGDDELE
jgi:hypothetical protein